MAVVSVSWCGCFGQEAGRRRVPGLGQAVTSTHLNLSATRERDSVTWTRWSLGCARGATRRTRHTAVRKLPERNLESSERDHHKRLQCQRSGMPETRQFRCHRCAYAGRCPLKPNRIGRQIWKPSRRLLIHDLKRRRRWRGRYAGRQGSNNSSPHQIVQRGPFHARFDQDARSVPSLRVGRWTQLAKGRRGRNQGPRLRAPLPFADPPVSLLERARGGEGTSQESLTGQYCCVQQIE